MKGILIGGIILAVILLAGGVYWYTQIGPGEKFVQTCHYGPNFSPDSLCTPGDGGGVDLKILCAPAKYDSKISRALTREVFGKYGINDTSKYKIDNLVPLELGGSNDITNLWPEPLTPVPGFNEKNKAELKLHDLVCSKRMPLNSAQYMISHDWKINTGLWK